MSVMMLLVMVFQVLGVTEARAQFALNFQIDDIQALAALGTNDRREMNKALSRVKLRFEELLASSTPIVGLPLRWQAPPAENTIANASLSPRIFAWPLVRDRLVNTPNHPSEPASEVLLYESLPTSFVAFRWNSVRRLASSCSLTYFQAQQLLLNPLPLQAGEAELSFRPPGAFNGSTLKWYFRTGPTPPGTNRFSALLAHEVLHILGFDSVADDTVAPTAITLLDVYRIADSQIPVNEFDLQTATRELRPDVEASCATQYRSAFGAGAYPMSRGVRAGGDGFQAPHFRTAARLTPPVSIGVMDPIAEQSRALPSGRLLRPDVEVLDVLGWTLEPNNVPLQFGGVPGPVITQPLAGARTRNTRPTFAWTDTTTGATVYDINIFRGDPTVINGYTDNFGFDLVPGNSYRVPLADALAPGEYTFEVIASGPGELDGITSGYRRLTILMRSDFITDGVSNVGDIFAYLAAWFARCNAPGAAPCFDTADQNDDGSITVTDIFAFLADWFARR